MAIADLFETPDDTGHIVQLNGIWFVGEQHLNPIDG